MTRTAVRSSNIRSIGFERIPYTQTDMDRDAAIAAHDLCIVEVEFTSSTVYQYFDVPRSVITGVLASVSIGSAFAIAIRNEPTLYRCERIDNRVQA